VIVESTILGGNPVMPEFGQGPGDAVKTILKQRDDFMPDRSLERFGFSFNPRGFLKRVKP
jgi:cephalosporin hydroxylase